MHERSERRRTGHKALSLAAALLALAPGTALADGIDPEEAPLMPQSGGAVPSTAGTLSSARCTKTCDGIDVARPGSSITLRGTGLKRAKDVIFLGADGVPTDDARARAQKVTGTQVKVRVPRTARSGKLTIRDRDGAVATPAPNVLLIDMTPPGSNGPITTRLVRKTATAGTARQAGVILTNTGSAAEPVLLSAVRVKDGVPVRTWNVSVPPVTPTRVDWDGTITGGTTVDEGRYEFIALSKGAATAQTATVASTETFLFVKTIFPIQGTHDYGGPEARFGAGRDGHSHQGQDVFAKCGTPLVAARGGKVKWVATHSAAGNYIVISTPGEDHAYMHMAAPAPFKKGDTIATGQPIGAVSDTGRASGCHLHFEIWPAPGWYEGGQPIDPLPQLKAWDAASAPARKR